MVELIRLEAEPRMVAWLEDATVASWIMGAADFTSRVPPPLPSVFAPAPRLPEWYRAKIGAMRYPLLEQAIMLMASKRVVPASEFYGLSRAARVRAFTVSHVASMSILEKLRDHLARNIATGGTLRGFARTVRGLLGEALSPSRIELIYRNNVLKAYGEGQKWAARHPLVRKALPYVRYAAVGDDRTRPQHLAMESHGIGGTAVYRVDDPVINRFWPPWDHGCRCSLIQLSVKDAARHGVGEAERWLRTGIEPRPPEFVPMPEFSPPPGWDWP